MKTSIFFSILLSASTLTTVNANILRIDNNKPVIRKVVDFDDFHAHRKQDGVALSWTNSSTGITNFIIQHSFDGFNFSIIGQVSPELFGWNKYEHDTALPGHNYYRIAAVLTNGTIEYSSVEVVRIVRRK
jgi:hypothetical protein